MTLDCPYCKKSVELPERGGSGDCPACGGAIVVRLDDAPVSPPPADTAQSFVHLGLLAARAGDYCMGNCVRSQ